MKTSAKEGLPDRKTPLIVAHRGASAMAPENTLPAFALAWKQGADAIEGDFRLTADGEVVCIHDADTKRVAGERLVVAESGLRELQALDVGSWKGERWKGTRIPTLDEVLSTLPEGKRIFIELKAGVEIVEPLQQVLSQSAVEEQQIVLISFSEAVVRAVRERLPGVTVNWLTEIRVNPLGRVHPSAQRILETLRRTDAHGVGLGAHWRLGAGFVRGIREAGFATHVWTVDRVWMARRLARMGVAAITTNRPDRLL